MAIADIVAVGVFPSVVGTQQFDVGIGCIQSSVAGVFPGTAAS